MVPPPLSRAKRPQPRYRRHTAAGAKTERRANAPWCVRDNPFTATSFPGSSACPGQARPSPDASHPCHRVFARRHRVALRLPNPMLRRESAARRDRDGIDRPLHLAFARHPRGAALHAGGRRERQTDVPIARTTDRGHAGPGPVWLHCHFGDAQGRRHGRKHETVSANRRRRFRYLRRDTPKIPEICGAFAVYGIRHRTAVDKARAGSDDGLHRPRTRRQTSWPFTKCAPTRSTSAKWPKP